MLQEVPEEEEAEDKLTTCSSYETVAAVEGEKVNKDRDANSCVTARSRGVLESRHELVKTTYCLNFLIMNFRS